MLLNDIVTVLTEDNEKPESDDKNLREYQPKLKVIQMLLDLAKSYTPKKYKDNEKVRNAIKVKVDDDEQLSGYMFFVSQNKIDGFQIGTSINSLGKNYSNIVKLSPFTLFFST